MDNDPIQLEHQTAPESTRGLFDPPETKVKGGGGGVKVTLLINLRIDH